MHMQSTSAGCPPWIAQVCIYTCTYIYTYTYAHAVDERGLPAVDRARLADLDLRASDAAAQMGVHMIYSLNAH